MEGNGMVRLNKYLSQSGITSRRRADLLIREGRVKVNGEVVTVLGCKIQEESDSVEVDGIAVKKIEQHTYLALNKPPGFLVTLEDPHRRPTVMDLISEGSGRVFPVGRLDMNSEGLLLLMDDGELAHRLMHPRYHIPKEYHVLVKGCPDAPCLELLRKGIVLDGRRTAPANVKLLSCRSGKSLIEVEIREGRKREIRRMMDAVGHAVVSLKRVKFAGLALGGLKPGKWRRLTSAEVNQLKSLVELS